jgi:tetratricopeptide (TPR) repeat protein
MIRRLVALGVVLFAQNLVVGQIPAPEESTAVSLSRVRSIAYSGLRGSEDAISTNKDDLPGQARLPQPPVGQTGTISTARLRHRVPKAARKAYQGAYDLAHRGDADGALRELERAVVLDTDWAEAHNDLGVQYVWRAQYPRAEIEFQRTVELAPESSVARVNLALVQLQLGNRSEAAQNLRRAVQSAPSDMKAHLLLERFFPAGTDSHDNAPH